VDPKKKTVAAKERDTVARLLFQDMAQTLSVAKVVVVDESGTHLDMTNAYARAPRGERAFDQALRNYGSNVSLLSALRLSGMHAPFVVEGAVNTAVFEAYTEHILAPLLQPGDIVVMDNLPCHKTETVRLLIEQRGASVLFLPAYSPDLSPIEHAFAKLKQFLRRVKALTFETLLDAIAAALQTISPSDALGFFCACGYFNID
jgi:transposase